ncbi:HET-domain-containing protein, partial [Tothia fuscella]
IRLVQLKPGMGADTLSCSLKIFSDFATAPRYDALSYCWGDMRDRSSLRVTKNLSAALHRLRQRGQSQPIWADAICIDQENISERNQQVSIMDEIYRHALRILVWINEGHE